MRLGHAVIRAKRASRVLALVLLIVLAANLFYHGAQPYAVGAIPPPWDKLAHLALFGVIAALAWVAGAGRAWLALLVAAALGAADEIAQGFNPGRSVDFGDWITDLAGALIVVGCLVYLRRMRGVSLSP